MSAFVPFYHANLHGLTIQDTAELIHDNLVPVNEFACLLFLIDIMNGEGKKATNDVSQLIADRLITYYPKVKWGIFAHIHKSIMDGTTEVKSFSASGIIRIVNKFTSSDYTTGLNKPEIKQKGETELQHRENYLNRYPDHKDIIDTQITLTSFLQLHTIGMFPGLEMLKIRMQCE